MSISAFLSRKEPTFYSYGVVHSVSRTALRHVVKDPDYKLRHLFKTKPEHVSEQDWDLTHTHDIDPFIKDLVERRAQTSLNLEIAPTDFVLTSNNGLLPLCTSAANMESNAINIFTDDHGPTLTKSYVAVLLSIVDKCSPNWTVHWTTDTNPKEELRRTIKENPIAPKLVVDPLISLWKRLIRIAYSEFRCSLPNSSDGFLSRGATGCVLRAKFSIAPSIIWSALVEIACCCRGVNKDCMLPMQSFRKLVYYKFGLSITGHMINSAVDQSFQDCTFGYFIYKKGKRFTDVAYGLLVPIYFAGLVCSSCGFQFRTFGCKNGWIYTEDPHLDRWSTNTRTLRTDDAFSINKKHDWESMEMFRVAIPDKLSWFGGLKELCEHTHWTGYRTQLLCLNRNKPRDENGDILWGWAGDEYYSSRMSGEMSWNQQYMYRFNHWKAQHPVFFGKDLKLHHITKAYIEHIKEELSFEADSGVYQHLNDLLHGKVPALSPFHCQQVLYGTKTPSIEEVTNMTYEEVKAFAIEALNLKNIGTLEPGDDPADEELVSL